MSLACGCDWPGHVMCAEALRLARRGDKSYLAWLGGNAAWSAVLEALEAIRWHNEPARRNQQREMRIR